MTTGNDIINGTINDDILVDDLGNDTLIGDAGNDSFSFDSTINFGDNLIIDDNGTILLDGAPITLEADVTATAGVFVTEQDGNYFVLSRTNFDGEIDLEGANLTLTLNHTSQTTNNRITIENFDFENGGFGITLNNISTVEFTGQNQIIPFSQVETLALSNGNALVFYNNRADGGRAEITPSIVDSEGNILAQAPALAQGGIAFIPSATELSDGNIAVSWVAQLSPDTEQNRQDIFVQIITPEGEAVSEVITVNENRFLSQTTPFVEALTDGGFVVHWLDQAVGASLTTAATNQSLVSRTFTNDGTATRGEVAYANPDIGTVQQFLHFNLPNDVVAVLTLNENNSDNITYRTIDADGNVLSEHIDIIDASTHGDNFIVTDFAVSGTESGEFSLIYEFSSSTEDNTVAVQRFANDATTLTAATILDIAPVISSPFSHIHEITTLSEGVELAIYVRPIDGTSNAELVFQRLTTDGTLIGDAVVIQDAPLNFLLQDTTAVQVFSNGNFALFSNQTSSTTTIVSYYDADANPLTSGVADLPIFGTDASDALIGTSEDDIIIANDGDDDILASDGADVIDGGEGSDSLRLEGNIDEFTLFSFNGDFSIESNAEPNNSAELISIESLVFDDGNLIFDGTDYVQEQIVENTAPELALPLEDQETNINNAFIFTIPEGSFTDADGDILSFTATLADGSPLPSWLTLSAEGAFIGAPTENDLGTLDILVTASDNNGGTASDIFSVDIVSNIVGTIGNDELIGTSVADNITLLEGDDTISAGNGDDTIDGGFGNDSLVGGTGNDIINDGDFNNDEIQFKDTLDGREGDDILIATHGKDILIGGSGNDTLEGGLNADIFVFEFEEGARDVITDFNIEDDLIDISSSGFSHLTFLSDLTLTDTDTGVDVDFGGHTVALNGVSASDLEFSHFEGLVTEDQNMTLRGTRFDDVLVGAGGDDWLIGRRGNDQLFGRAGDDFAVGGLHADLLEGEDGNDYLFGGFHNDTINGGDGEDYLVGSIGQDILNGGLDQDILIGGRGADRFVFTSTDDSNAEASDVIVDFSVSSYRFWWLRGQQDFIDLSAIESIDSFTDLSFSSGEAYGFDTTVVSDNNSDFEFELLGNLTLNEDHFIF